MNFRVNRSRTSLLLIYGVAAALLFLLGVVCGRVVLDGSPPSSPSASEADFIVGTATPPIFSLATPLPDSTACGPPTGWALYTIQPGDTLSDLATRFQVSQGRILKANCLTSPDDLLAGQTLYLPPLPTSTPCVISPPVGWEAYIVQSNDTVFSLAAARGTTPVEIIQVNCLTLPDNLPIGQPLYLPPLPTPTPTQLPSPTLPLPTPTFLPTQPPPELAFQPLPDSALAQPPGSAPQAPSGETVEVRLPRRGDAPGSAIYGSAPNTGKDPCSRPTPEGHQAGEPWISIPAADGNNLERGQRVYFFACEFTAPEATPELTTTWTAQLDWFDGTTQTLDVQFHLPPYLSPYQSWEMGNAEGVVVWNAICTLPRDRRYTLIMKRNQKEISFPFELKKPNSGRIFVAPQVGSAGITFQVFYCDYPPDKIITVKFYYQAARLILPTPVPIPLPGFPTPQPADPGVLWRPAGSWDVAINSYGWAVQPLPSARNDQTIAYYLTDTKDAEDVFWLSR